MLWRPRGAAKRVLRDRWLVLKWCAAGFAVVTTAVMIAAVTLGFGWSGWAWPVGPVVFGLVWLLNARAVSAANDNAPSWKPPRLRVGTGVALGFVAGYAAALWVFAVDIENARNERPVRWEQAVAEVLEGIKIAKKVMYYPISTVDGHPELRARSSALKELRSKAAQAQLAADCEQLRSCTTRFEPVGEGFRSAKEYAERLAADVRTAEKEYNDLKTEVESRIEAEKQQRYSAEKRVADLNAQSEKLGPRPQPLTTWESVRVVGDRRNFAVWSSGIGAFVVCLLVDMGVFLYIVRRVCRAEVSHK